MDRRDALAALVALGACTGSRYSLAQAPAKVPILGLLSEGLPSTPEQWDKTRFALKLKELGWVNGKNLIVERVYGEGKTERLPALAAELVRKRANVIFAVGPEAAVDAARTTTTIPIVFWGVSAPLEQGLIASYARPGRNVTGVAYNADLEIFPKLLHILRQLSPAASRAAYFSFWTALRTVGGGTFSEEVDRRMETAAKRLGFDLQAYPIAKREDFDAAFKGILGFRAQALVTLTTWFSYLERQRIIEFANRNRLLSVFDTMQFADAGGLVSYGPDILTMYEQAAGYVDRVLRGAKPGDLPVEQPSKFELAVNLTTARTLGLTIPQSVLVQADRLIE